MFQTYFLISISLLLAACGGSKAPEQKAPPPTPVNVYEVKKEAAFAASFFSREFGYEALR